MGKLRCHRYFGVSWIWSERKNTGMAREDAEEGLIRVYLTEESEAKQVWLMYIIYNNPPLPSALSVR